MDQFSMKKNKRVSFDEDHDENSKSKRICPASTSTGQSLTLIEDNNSDTDWSFEGGPDAERGLKLLSQIQPFLNNLVQAEVDNALQTHIYTHLESLREKKEKGEKVVSQLKFKVLFCNEIASTIYTNDGISGENGEPLRVAICDAITDTVICTGSLSSVQIEFFILDGDYGSDQEEEEACSNMSDFNQSILSPRDGKRPLMVGNDKKLTLKNGVGLIKNLNITDNSSWIKSKKFRMGAKVRDQKVLAKFPNIGIAMSQPFRVMDHRGKVNQKHHPPSREDEVWRLEGIRKDGVYHRNLTSQGFRTVGDFLNLYVNMGPLYLKKLLGTKVPEKTWTMMVGNAFECAHVPSYEQNSMVNVLGNDVMKTDEAFNESHQPFEHENPRLCFDEPEFENRDLTSASAPFEASVPIFDSVITSLEEIAVLLTEPIDEFESIEPFLFDNNHIL